MDVPKISTNDTQSTAPRQMVSERGKEPVDFSGTILLWLQTHNLKMDNIELEGELEKNNEGLIDAELRSKKIYKEGKEVEAQCLKGAIVWTVKDKTGKVLHKVRESFPTRVEYPSEGDFKRFALWANIHIATMRLPFTDPAAREKIDDIAQGYLIYRLKGASTMRDYTAVEIRVGKDQRSTSYFKIDIIDKTARDAIEQVKKGEDLVELERVGAPRDPRILREKIFRDAELIRVMMGGKVQNEDVVGRAEAAALEDIDPEELDANETFEALLAARGTKSEEYIDALKSRAETKKEEYDVFSKFFLAINLKLLSTSDLVDKLLAIEAEAIRDEAAKRKKRDLLKQILNDAKLKDIAQENVRHMERIRDVLKNMQKQLAVLQGKNVETTQKQIEQYLSELEPDFDYYQKVVYPEGVPRAETAPKTELSPKGTFVLEEVSKPESLSEAKPSPGPTFVVEENDQQFPPIF